MLWIICLFNDIELLCNRESSLSAVSSDHNDSDSSSLAILDGWFDLVSNWVFDADDTYEGGRVLMLVV